MPITVSRDLSLNHRCLIINYGCSEFSVSHLTKESFSYNYLTPYAWHIYTHTHKYICVYIYTDVCMYEWKEGREGGRETDGKREKTLRDTH